MIARFFIKLPFRLFMPASLDVDSFDTIAHGERVRVYTPVQSQAAVDTSWLFYSHEQLVRALSPAEARVAADFVLIGNKPTVTADLLIVDFNRPSFDRSMKTPDMSVINPETPSTQTTDPPAIWAIEVANSFIQRLRVLSRGILVKLLDPGRTLWRVRYYDGDGGELPKQEGVIRGMVGAHSYGEVVRFDHVLWEGIKGLPDGYQQPPWDSLLLDAVELLSEPGASVAMSFTALEIFIAWALDELAEAQIRSDIWHWLNNRERRDFNPNITEQYDVLLRVLGGRSLKESNAELWEAFMNLRSLRNNFIHEGRLAIGSSSSPATPETIKRLVGKAFEIIRWVEALLPPAMQRPTVNSSQEVEVRLFLRDDYTGSS